MTGTCPGCLSRYSELLILLLDNWLDLLSLFLAVHVYFSGLFM
uniref:Uncharacterized protein n=1 Tax=Arundo donax TaxID=35708 RepID=A0A0A8ZSX6_ARUDO